MSKTCKNCGNTFEDHMNICPRCGMQYVEDMQMPQQPNQQQYQQPQYQQPQYTQYPYQQPMAGQPVPDQPMTMGQWLGTILLTTMLGTVSLILLFVWAFSSNTPPTKKNYCRAMLIIQAISVVLSIILIAVFFSIMASNPEFTEAFNSSFYA